VPVGYIVGPWFFAESPVYRQVTVSGVIEKETGRMVYL
jgi:hypothetical protein